MASKSTNTLHLRHLQSPVAVGMFSETVQTLRRVTAAPRTNRILRFYHQQ